MIFDKRPFTFEEQAERLISRGLVADKTTLVQRLQATNYYRLTSYLYTFREDGERYRKGTTLEKVLELYRFDHGLRLLLLDAIETIEVHARTQLAYHFAHTHGAFAYLDRGNFPNFEDDRQHSREDFIEWERRLRQQVRRSQGKRGREDFIVHFFNKYGDQHDMPPIWMMVELMDFGSVLSFYRGVATDLRRKLADSLGVHQKVALNWLLALNTVRNRCAHHARLWNWNLGYPATIPERDPCWKVLSKADRKVAAVLHICRHWLEKAHVGLHWPQRVEEHFAKFVDVDLKAMGLVPGWTQREVWKLNQ